MDGNDIYGAGVDPVNVRREVGMVFQRANPFPTMSIKENVLAGVRLNNKRLSKSAADDLTERALRGANLWNEVKDRLNLPGSGLSGGQQQRLCIARAIAVEFRDRNIRANAVCPGFIATDHGRREMELLTKHGVDASQEAIAADQGRLCEPEEVARAALFLLSDDASFVSGSHLFVDNGFTAI